MNSETVKRIRMRRLERDIPSDAALARRIGVTPACLCNILRGYRRGEATRKKLARELRMPVDQLLCA